MIRTVKASNYAIYPNQYIALSLEVSLGGDAGATAEQEIGLSLVVSEFGVTTANLEQEIDLSLFIGAGPDYFKTLWAFEEIGLRLDFTTGETVYNVILVWDPWESPLLTGKNYTYIFHLGLEGTDVEGAEIVVRFEGSLVTEKTTNATGFVEYWAIVGASGLKTWSFTIFEGGLQRAIAWKDVLYADSGPGPDPDPPDGPGPTMPDLPTEPGSLFVVLDFLPVMVVFGIFSFAGMLVMGRIGLMIGGVGAFFVLTAMGTLPSWILFFAILVTILVIVFKLKSGGSNVTVEGGNGA